MSLLCGCVMAGQIAERINYCKCTQVFGTTIGLIILGLVLIIDVQFGFWTGAILFALVGVNINFAGIYIIVLTINIRKRVRMMFDIPGDGCQDCLCSFFCNWSTFNQSINKSLSHSLSHSIGG